MKSRIGSYFLLPEESLPMRIQQKVASYEKNCKWKTSLIGHANGSKVVYSSADPAGPFNLYGEYYVRNEVNQTI